MTAISSNPSDDLALLRRQRGQQYQAEKRAAEPTRFEVYKACFTTRIRPVSFQEFFQDLAAETQSARAAAASARRPRAYARMGDASNSPLISTQASVNIPPSTPMITTVQGGGLSLDAIANAWEIGRKDPLRYIASKWLGIGNWSAKHRTLALADESETARDSYVKSEKAGDFSLLGKIMGVFRLIIFAPLTVAALIYKTVDFVKNYETWKSVALIYRKAEAAHVAITQLPQEERLVVSPFRIVPSPQN